MHKFRFDPEILYVQKLYFFLFLSSFSIASSAIIGWYYGWKIGLGFLMAGIMFSYAAMVKKKQFYPPEKKFTVQRMAREISHDTSPLSIARFASQLYFYLRDTKRAISLLEKFLHTYDPLLYATLADILLKEGSPKKALSILRDNPYTITDPLLLATQGHILKSMDKIAEAAKIYERCLHFAKESGFPHNGAHWLTQKLLTLSYTANIHHALADCYTLLKEPNLAKRHYRAGNLRFLDFSFWRFSNNSILLSAKSYTKSR